MTTEPTHKETAITPNRFAYMRRLRAVQEGAPRCGARGPSHARCVLPPDHVGADHEGNGNDEWGPKYVAWVSARKGDE